MCRITAGVQIIKTACMAWDPTLEGDAIITSPDFFFHEGWGYLSVVIDPRESKCCMVGSLY